jgi:hypothetical protein
MASRNALPARAGAKAFQNIGKRSVSVVEIFSPHPKPEKRVKPPREQKPRKRPPEKNPARKAHRLITDFGGPEYNELLRSLPCAVCGVVGFSVAAHLTARGAGGKAQDTVPLCRTRFDLVSGVMKLGCHEKYDARDKTVRAFEERLRWLAKGLWWAWQAIT